MTNLEQTELIKSTSSQEDILANLSPSQVAKKVSKIRDTSGQKCLDLSKNSDLLGSLEKTLVDTLNSVSTPYSRTWRVKATPQGRLVFQLLASAPTTKEKESGLWRTPDAVSGGSNLPGIQRALDSGHLKRPSGQPIQIRLHDQVREPRLWPTPRVKGDENLDTLIKRKGIQKAVQHNLKAAVQMWPEAIRKRGEHRAKTAMLPTPTAQDSKNNGGPSQQRRKTKPLNAVAGGTLNPTWVEWLMGYPKGWTDLNV